MDRLKLILFIVGILPTITEGNGGDTLRLSEGGVLEVQRSGGDEWRTICTSSFLGQSFTHRQAFIACKTLNKTLNEASLFATTISVRDSATNRNGTGVWHVIISCNGSENSLFDCSVRYHNTGPCGHEEDVAILCQDINQSHTNVTLEGESMIDNLGYVILDLAGERGSVCDKRFGENEAKVACRSLGLRTDGAKVVPNPTPLMRSEFQVPETIWLDDVVCHGGEVSLLHCQHNRIGVNLRNCYDTDAVAVYCGPTDDDAVQLVGGIDAGRVEVKLYGQWGTVCDSQTFNYLAARVVCRQLNLTSSGAAKTRKYASGSGFIWLPSVACHGDESSLTDCYHGLIGSVGCSHNFDVGVECKESPVTTTVPSNSNAYHHRSDFPIGRIIGIVIEGVVLTVLSYP